MVFSGPYTSPEKKRSPTRANSMPPRPSRPQVLRRISVPMSGQTDETYSINGVNYTTYTTFRSPLTPEAAESDMMATSLPPNISEQQPPIPEPDYDDHFDGGMYTSYNGMSRSVNYPQQQYQQQQQPPRPQMMSKTLERKKKKSVSFLVNDDILLGTRSAPSVNTSSPLRGNGVKPESILKPQQDQQQQQQQQLPPPMLPTHCQHGKPITQEHIMRGLSSEKYVQPIEKFPVVKLASAPPSIPTSMPPTARSSGSPPSASAKSRSPPQEQQPALLKTVVKVVPEDRIRIDVPPSTTTGNGSGLLRSNSVTAASTSSSRLTLTTTSTSGSKSTNTASGLTHNSSAPNLQKSQSFSADKIKNTNSTGGSVAKSVKTISENDILKARSNLKPSRSFPNELENNNQNHLNVEENDNSSSGVSSDQETQKSSLTLTTTTATAKAKTASAGKVSNVDKQKTTKFVTYLPVDNATSTSTIKWEDNSESGSSETSWVVRSEEEESNSGKNLVSMKRMLHPKLQAIFDMPAGSVGSIPGAGAGGSPPPTSKASSSSKSKYSSQTLPHKIKSKDKHGHRSISESLALINQHVNSLGEVNNIITSGSGSGSEKTGKVKSSSRSSKQKSEAATTAAVLLAPPPGFSDPESMSDNESLSSLGSAADRHHQQQQHHRQLQQKFGIKGAPRQAPGSGYAPQPPPHGLPPPPTHKKPSKSSKSDLMSRSLDGFIDPAVAAKLHPDLDTHSGGGGRGSQHYKAFRTKPLMGWSTNDVCDWLDSLFMPEYKPAFVQAEIDGLKLASLTKSELESLGVIRVGHMLNIEKSLKRYLTT